MKIEVLYMIIGGSDRNGKIRSFQDCDSTHRWPYASRDTDGRIAKDIHKTIMPALRPPMVAQFYLLNQEGRT